MTSAKPNAGPKRGAVGNDPAPVGANVSEVDQRFLVAQVGCDPNEYLWRQATDGKPGVFLLTGFCNRQGSSPFEGIHLDRNDRSFRIREYPAAIATNLRMCEPKERVNQHPAPVQSNV